MGRPLYSPPFPGIKSAPDLLGARGTRASPRSPLLIAYPKSPSIAPDRRDIQLCAIREKERPPNNKMGGKRDGRKKAGIYAPHRNLAVADGRGGIVEIALASDVSESWAGR